MYFQKKKPRLVPAIVREAIPLSRTVKVDVNISGVVNPDICLVADIDIMPVKPLWKYKPDWREKFVKERNNEKI
jgi:hypothetical protein